MSNIVKLRTTVFPEYDATTEHDGGGGGADLSDRILDFLAGATQENWNLAIEATFDALVKMLNIAIWPEDTAVARFTQKSEQMRKVLVKTLDQVGDAQIFAQDAVLANRERLSDDE
jgi:hypothetical protein